MIAADGFEGQIAQPTITEALDGCLADTQKRLKPQTYTRYADVIAVLADTIDQLAGPSGRNTLVLETISEKLVPNEKVMGDGR